MMAETDTPISTTYKGIETLTNQNNSKLLDGPHNNDISHPPQTQSQPHTKYKSVTSSSEVDGQQQPWWKALRACSCCWPGIRGFYRQSIMSLVTCLAGLSNGMIYAYPAVALGHWEEEEFKLTTAQVTWFASTPLVVAVVVAVVGGVVVERLGVRLCLNVGTALLVFTWLLIGHATHFWMLIVARFIQGLVASAYMVIITVYPAEVSEVQYRGIMSGFAEAMVMLGAFLTYLGGLVFLPGPLANAFAVALIPQFFLFFFLQESPLWLARQDREKDVMHSLTCLRGSGSDIKAELEYVKASVHTEKTQKPTAAKQLLLIRKPIYLRPLVLCVLVLLFKELTGQHAALTYTVKMFRMAGSTLDPYWCAVVMGAIRFLPCFMSWALIEKLNRRLLLSTCLGVSAISLSTLGGFLWAWSGSSNGLPPHLGWVPLTCLSIFTLAYGIGVGPTSWTFVGELLPSRVRNVGGGILCSCFSLYLFIVGLTFPYSVEAVGVGVVFIVYGVCSVCGVIFVLTCLPETRGKSLTEIQNKFGSSTKPSNAL